MGLFTAALFIEHPFSLTYGVILPSSLATVLSLTLGYSPCLPVSVCGTGSNSISARSFSRDLSSHTSLLGHPFTPHHAFALNSTDLPMLKLFRLDAHPIVRLRYPHLSLHHLYPSTGISTCCPSTTPFGLILGPDLPRADEPSPRNLRQTVCRILTCISLLTPEFSLPIAPALLTVHLQCNWYAPLPSTLKY